MLVRLVVVLGLAAVADAGIFSFLGRNCKQYSFDEAACLSTDHKACAYNVATGMCGNPKKITTVGNARDWIQQGAAHVAKSKPKAICNIVLTTYSRGHAAPPDCFGDEDCIKFDTFVNTFFSQAPNVAKLVLGGDGDAVCAKTLERESTGGLSVDGHVAELQASTQIVERKVAILVGGGPAEDPPADPEADKDAAFEFVGNIESVNSICRQYVTLIDNGFLPSNIYVYLNTEVLDHESVDEQIGVTKMGLRGWRVTSMTPTAGNIEVNIYRGCDGVVPSRENMCLRLLPNQMSDSNLVSVMSGTHASGPRAVDMKKSFVYVYFSSHGGATNPKFLTRLLPSVFSKGALLINRQITATFSNPGILSNNDLNKVVDARNYKFLMFVISACHSARLQPKPAPNVAFIASAPEDQTTTTQVIVRKVGNTNPRSPVGGMSTMDKKWMYWQTKLCDKVIVPKTLASLERIFSMRADAEVVGVFSAQNMDINLSCLMCVNNAAFHSDCSWFFDQRPMVTVLEELEADLDALWE